MTAAIVFIDVAAACFFFSAAIITDITSRLSGRRTRMWAYVTVACAFLALEQGTNALEWGGGDVFSPLDTFQGYMAVVASIALVAVALSFLSLAKRVQRDDSE